MNLLLELIFPLLCIFLVPTNNETLSALLGEKGFGKIKRSAFLWLPATSHMCPGQVAYAISGGIDKDRGKMDILATHN